MAPSAPPGARIRAVNPPPAQESPVATLAARIDLALPQMQCGRCGHPACRPYADAVAGGEAHNRCAPGGDALIATLAVLTRREPLPLDPAHGVARPLEIASVDEAACIGCTLCIAACPVDAIAGGPKRKHSVVSAWCTGCALCLPPCPVDCIALLPAGREWSPADATAARSRHAAHSRRAARPKAPPGANVAAPTPHDAEARRRSVAAALARARARRGAVPAKRSPE
jgi:electron transport complex protein RnfB